MLTDFVNVANAIAATPKKGEKERLLASYLAALDDPSLERAVTFFSGAPFPRRDERVTGVGASTIADAVAAASGRTVDELWEIYPKYADLGDAVSEMFPSVAPHDLTLLELSETFDRLAATGGANEKAAELSRVLARVNGQEARYIDCVVTAAQYGSGKRRAVLSDLTFAVAQDGALVNIGKAYSGLTDVEIARLTEHFQATTTGRFGPVHVVEPQIVLEIAFDRIQESKRHKSGYALRFPRIARLRDDKSIAEVSTIDEVRRIYEGQLAREHRAQEI